MFHEFLIVIYLVDNRNNNALEFGALNALINFSRSSEFVAPSSPK